MSKLLGWYSYFIQTIPHKIVFFKKTWLNKGEIAYDVQ